MHKNGDTYAATPVASARHQEPSDEDTAELPVLSLDGHEDGTPTEAIPTLQPPAESIDSTGEARASSWVSSMEGEIQWLQERWQTLDRELRRSEERARKLAAESEEKDRTIADLESEINRQVRSIEELNARRLERESVVAALEKDRAGREERLAEKVAELTRTRGEAAVLEDRLQAVLRERDELGRALTEEKTRLIEQGARKDAIEATNQRLATKVQDLEIYIEGRRDKWSSLNHALESGRARIAELEAAVARGAERLDEREAEIESLEQRIVEIERARSEAEGRHQEREVSYREMQTRLTDQAAEIGGLRAAANDRNSGFRLADEAAEQHRQELEALEESLAGREQVIRSLETELASTKALNEHMETRGAAERDRLGELQRELAGLGVDRDRLAEQLAGARDEIEALGRKLADAEASVEVLSDESAGQQTRIAELEADLARRSEVIRAFDRHAKRLSALKQNLHSIPEDQDEAELADEHVAESAPSAPQIGIGETEAGSRTIDPLPPLRRMIVPLDADPSDHPEYSLSKPIVTIGRAKTSDIRIIDAVVSRMHARLTTDNDMTIIEDLGSKNGVLVNSRPVDRAVLHHGDVISLGANHDFRYVELGHATH
jgi:chromosome segregation ATPase